MGFPPKNSLLSIDSYMELLVNTANEYLKKNNRTVINLGDFEQVIDACNVLKFEQKNEAFELMKQTLSWVSTLEEVKGYVQKNYLNAESDECFTFHQVAINSNPNNVSAGERVANINEQVNRLRQEKNSYKTLVEVISGKINVLNKYHYICKMVLEYDKDRNY